MLYIITWIFIRRYKRSHPLFNKTIFRLINVVRILLLVAAISCLVITARTQERNLFYTIKQNGDQIGTMTVNETQQGNLVSYKLQSDVKKSFLFSFKVKAIEEAVFQNGVLLYSFVYQLLNGSEKVNKNTRLSGNNYVVTANGTEEKIDSSPITYNMVCLYTTEPLNIQQVFSDKYQQYLTISKTGLHQYHINFPDGNYNDYDYENGVCTKVHVHHSFYSAVMELEGK